MIASFRPSTRTGRCVGAAALLGLGWATFTSAAPDAPTLPDRPSQSEELRQVHVERHTPPPPWVDALREKLDAKIELNVRETPASEVFAFLRQAGGFNLVVEPDFLEDRGDPELTLVIGRTSIASALDLIGRAALDDMDWCLAREAVYVGDRGSLPEALDLRFYRVTPLLEDPWSDGPEEVIDLVITFIDDASGAWDREGAFIEHWNGLLVVRQTDAVHRRVEALLNRLLNRGREPEVPEPDWQDRLAKALRAPVTLNVEGEEAGVVAAQLAASHGVPIVLDEDAAYETVTLELDGVSLGAALTWLADQSSTRVSVDAGTVFLGHDWNAPRLEFYPVNELYELAEDSSEDEVQSRLSDMLRTFVEPASWDESPAFTVHFWSDMMLVTQTASGHAAIRELLAAMTRALRA